VKKYLVLFTCSENGEKHQEWLRLSAESQQDRASMGAAATDQWMARYGDRISPHGGSLGTKTVRVDPTGIHEVPSKMGKYIVAEASSHIEAAKMFIDHPHFTFFPGDGVEILEIIDSRG
jgi:hypothetical protein